MATPGRLIDHLENSGLAPRLSAIRVLVLDEADHLLEMGFRPAIEKVLSFLPRARQTLLFSATMPNAVHQVGGGGGGRGRPPRARRGWVLQSHRVNRGRGRGRGRTHMWE